MRVWVDWSVGGLIGGWTCVWVDLWVSHLRASDRARSLDHLEGERRVTLVGDAGGESRREFGEALGGDQ